MRISSFIKNTTILSSLVLLSACAADGNNMENDKFVTSYDSQVTMYSPDSAAVDPKNLANDRENMVATGMEINSSLTDLEKIERYNKQRIIKVKDEDMASIGLGKRVFVDWTGPVEPLLSEIAAYTNYKFKVVGLSPAIPVIITVVSSDIEVGDIVRTAHLQARERADVVIYPRSKTIELRYFEMG